MDRILLGLLFAFCPSRARADEPAQRSVPLESADNLLNRVSQNDWSMVLMDQPGRKIVFTFGDLGRQTVELYWARERGASIGEQQQRLNHIYGEDGSAASSQNAAGGFVSVSGGAASQWSARASSDLSRAANELNAGKFGKAQNDVTLVESEASKLPAGEQQDYTAAAGALRRMNGVLASGEALRRLVRAAPGGDFTERESLQKSQRFYAQGMGLDTEPFLDAADGIWDAYKTRLKVPAEPKGDLKAALAELDGAERMVQKRFKRSDYLAAMERVWKDAAGLSGPDRIVLAGRLRRHAQMWNTVAADALALAWYVAASGKPELAAQRAALLAQAQWKGSQGGRAEAFARALLTFQ